MSYPQLRESIDFDNYDKTVHQLSCGWKWAPRPHNLLDYRLSLKKIAFQLGLDEAT
jgi:hypothetical protein